MEVQAQASPSERCMALQEGCELLQSAALSSFDNAPVALGCLLDDDLDIFVAELCGSHGQIPQLDAGLDAACMDTLNGLPALLPFGEDLFPGATTIKLLDADAGEADLLGPISQPSSNPWACPAADRLTWCSQGALRQHGASAHSLYMMREPSPGTPDSMHSQVSGQTCAASHAWQGGMPAAVSCPDLTQADTMVDASAWGGDPQPPSSHASLVRSAISSMGSLTSLLPPQHDSPFAEGSNDTLTSSLPVFETGPLAAKRTIVRPRRAAAYVPTLPAGSRGRRRWGSGGQPCKVAPNPDGHSCSACGTQTTPVWRAGPLGPKTLCNACGVRYMKVAKKK